MIISGLTRNHLRAIGETIEEKLKKEFESQCFAAVGYGDTDWVVLDYRDLVVHVFTPTTRDYYSLERLWGDAPLVEWKVEAGQN